MIYGIGTDIIEIDRFKTPKAQLLQRLYTPREIQLFAQRPMSLAGNFACKEAVAKAMGTGFRGFYPRDIEILRDDLGKPYCVLQGKALELCRAMGVDKVHLSLSHNKTTACGFAILEGD